MANFFELPKELEIESIHAKEGYLRDRFLEKAIVNDYEKGYISVPFVNQLIDLELQGYAADIIAHNINSNGISVDKIVQIPYSGNSLATSVAERLRVPLVLGRKEKETPGAWQEVFLIQEKIHSFTTGKDLLFIFNEIRKGDRVYIIDDVIANGDTAPTIISEFMKEGIEVMGMAVYFAKLFQPGVEKIKEQTGIESFSVIGIESINPERIESLAPSHF